MSEHGRLCTGCMILTLWSLLTDEQIAEFRRRWNAA